VIESGLNVRQTEELVRRSVAGAEPGREAPAPRHGDPETAALESQVRASLGTKVELRRRASGQGRLVLHFYSDEELDGLLDRLGVTID
jgi:ParB family chromosome partitioning protein